MLNNMSMLKGLSNFFSIELYYFTFFKIWCEFIENIPCRVFFWIVKNFRFLRNSLWLLNDLTFLFHINYWKKIWLNFGIISEVFNF